MKADRKNIAPGFVLLFFISTLILHRCFGYIGHYGYDDIHYAELAKNFLQGSFNFEDHASYRLPVIMLTALFYFLFGISDFSSSLPSLLISTAILLIVFSILKKEGTRTVVIGLALTTLSNWFLFYSDKIMPDIYVAFAFLAAIASIHRYKFETNKTRPFQYGVLFSVSLMFGFLAKGTIVLILPLLLYYFVIDLILKRDAKFWIYSVGTGFLLLGIYFVVLWAVTGDFFKRFEAIANNSYLNPCSYEAQPIKILLRRISYEFFQSLIPNSMAIGFVLVLSIFIQKEKHLYHQMNNSFSFFLLTSVVLLLSSNFMTISATSYSPMCLDVRHYLYLIPIVSIPAARIIVRYIETKAFQFQIVAGLLIIAVLSLILKGNMGWKLYIPMAALFSLYGFISVRKIHQNVFVLLFLIILIIKPSEMIGYARQVQYKKQKEIFTRYILDRNDTCLVITDEVQQRLGSYYQQFDHEGPVQITQFEEFRFDSTDLTKKILFLNWYTRYLSALDTKDLPYYANNISAANTLIYENKDLNIAIYEMTDFSVPALTGERIVYSQNDFEYPVPLWHQSDENITSEIKYAGTHSNRVEKYSTTFEYSLDSLLFNPPDKILVRAELQCYFVDKTDAKIVISVENKENAYIWEAKRVNQYIKAYSNWWPVKYEIEIESKRLKEGSNLKVYLLIGDEDPAYIDDFKIEVYGFD